MIATRTRAAFVKHPWTLDINDDPPIGPNSVRHVDQSLEAVASLDIPLADKVDIISVVDEYVFGYSWSERKRRHDRTAGDENEMVQSIVACTSRRSPCR